MSLQQCQNQICQELDGYKHAMVKSYIRLIKRVLILFVVENPHSQSAVLVGPIILVLVCLDLGRQHRNVAVLQW